MWYTYMLLIVRNHGNRLFPGEQGLFPGKNGVWAWLGIFVLTYTQYCYYYQKQTKLVYDLHFISLHRQCHCKEC